MVVIEELLSELVDVISDVHVYLVRHDEDAHRYIKVTLALSDRSTLRVSEFGGRGEDPVKYSYWWLDGCGNLIRGAVRPALHHPEYAVFAIH